MAKQQSKQQKTPNLFTLVSNGTHHAFNPMKVVVDIREKRRRHLVDVHKQYVLDMADPDRVYILDSNGERLRLQ